MKKYNWIDVIDTALELGLRLRMDTAPVTIAEVNAAISTGRLQDPRAIPEGVAAHLERIVAWLALAIEADEDNITEPLTLYVNESAVWIEDGKKRMRAYEMLAQEQAIAHGMAGHLFWMKDVPLVFAGPGGERFRAAIDNAIAFIDPEADYAGAHAANSRLD